MTKVDFGTKNWALSVAVFYRGERLPTSRHSANDVPAIFVGTSGWAYPAWKPAFYPKEVTQKRFLEHYASQLNTVEVNYSFRHLIAEKTLANWINVVPPGFVFCLKAHQAITHIKRLKNTEEKLRAFLQSVEPLAASDRLGAVLFQLPPNLKRDTGLLADFLALLPRSLRAAFEFRHESWFSDEIYAVLRQADAALCIAETDDLTVPDVATADFSYYRFRRSGYSASERRVLAARLQRAAAGRQVFAFVKHEERAESALWAAEILRLSRAALPERRIA